MKLSMVKFINSIQVGDGASSQTLHAVGKMGRDSLDLTFDEAKGVIVVRKQANAASQPPEIVPLTQVIQMRPLPVQPDRMAAAHAALKAKKEQVA